MVFVVKSTISNFSRRKAIRYTWGNVKMYGEIMLQTIFILGNTSDRAITEQIDLENHIHGDILQFDFPDTAKYVLLEFLRQSLLIIQLYSVTEEIVWRYILSKMLFVKLTL